MKPEWHGRWRLLAATVDTVFLGAALVLWTAARFGIHGLPTAFVPAPGRDFGRAPLAFAIPVWLLVFASFRLYNPQRSENTLEEARRLITAGLGAGLAMVMLGFIVKENPARSWLVGAMVFATLSGAMGRQTLRRIVARFRERGRWITRAVVVGRNEAKRTAEAMATDKSVGIQPVATCGLNWNGLPEWPLEELSAAVRATGASEVVIVAEDLSRHELNAALEVADELPVQVVVLPGFDHLLLGSLQLLTVGNEPGLAIEAPSLRGYQAALKRTTDMVAGLVLLMLSAPLSLAVAIAVKLDSRGPIVFRQKREGRAGAVFEVFKFRTMRTDAVTNDPENGDSGGSFFTKDIDDPRLTRLGRLLRRTSLDELPQLWNVVLGDMSLVGPRPLRLSEGQRLGLPRRLLVKPGLTGLWQVKGRSKLSAEERIRLDLVYVQNWSVLLDLSILLRTVPAVITGRGAY